MIDILSIKAGDILVFQTDMVLGQDQIDNLTARLKERTKLIAPDAHVLVLTCGLQLASVLRSGDGEQKSHPVVNCSE